MLIARAPVRISFAGGGTDVAAYYREHGGVVISTSINKYFYAILEQTAQGATQIISADYKTLLSLEHGPDTPDLIWEGDLILPRAILAHFGLQQGLNIFIASEVPPGTGLGSSSAAAVCLIKAFSTYQGGEISPAETARLACQVEIERLGMPIGKQDQFASAFGGLNQIEFAPDDTVRVTPLAIADATLAALQSSLLLFYTGVSRYSTNILEKQKASVQAGDRQVLSNLHAIKELAGATRECLEQGDLDTFGRLLHEGWLHKRGLTTNVTNQAINEVYETARQAGAVGGKITGAGGGGFLLLYAPPDRHPAITTALTAHGLKRMYFQFEKNGAQVVLNTPVGSNP